MITRQQVLDAAKRICPELGQHVPERIRVIDFLEMVGNHAFIHNLSGADIETIRQGLLQLSEDGYLV